MQNHVVVIGGGVIGLAIARKFAQSGANVVVLESREQIGLETSFRNSAVIHAGIYYPPATLKAKFCKVGRDKLYNYCQYNSVTHKKIGKIIIATNESQLSELNRLKIAAEHNGVHDLELLSTKEVKEKEPHIYSVGGLYSPQTGIINGKELMLAYKRDIEAANGQICCNSTVQSVQAMDQRFLIKLKERGKSIECTHLVNAAGLWAQSISNSIERLPKKSIPRTYYAKGNYYKLVGLNKPIAHLIYPIPEKSGLGIHATIDVNDNVFFGPDVEWIDTIDVTVNLERKTSFFQTIKTYLPMITLNNIEPAFAGIRPKITPEDEQPQDFEIQFAEQHGINNLVCLYGMESPGLTSSLSIADYVVENIK